MRAIDYIVEQMRKEAVIRTALKAGKKLRRNPFGKKVIGKTVPAVKPTPVPTQPVVQSNIVPSVNRRPEPVRQGKNPFGKKVIGKTVPAVKPTPVPTQPVVQSNTVPSVNRRPEPVRQGNLPNTREGTDMVRARGEVPVPAAPPVTGGIQTTVPNGRQGTDVVRPRGDTIPADTPPPVQTPEGNAQGTHKVNWTEQFRKWYEKDPLKTVAMTGGGLYLGKNIADKLIGNNKYGSLRLNKYVRKFIGK